MKRPVIVSIGEVLWDQFPDGARFGGAPANFACHVALLGGQVSMVSAVGKDPPGQEAIEIMRGYGLDTSLVASGDEFPTGSVGIDLDESGKPTFTIHENAAWDHLAWSTELETLINRSDAVYFGTLGQRSEVSRATIRRAMSIAERAGIPRVLDVNLRAPFFDSDLILESIRATNVLKFSDDELVQVCEACEIETELPLDQALEQLREKMSLDLVVMTCGSKGAKLSSEEGTIEQPGIPTDVRDTVGAGDSFTASFLLDYLQGEPHSESLRRACSVASAVCSHSGAVPK